MKIFSTIQEKIKEILLNILEKLFKICLSIFIIYIIKRNLKYYLSKENYEKSNLFLNIKY